MRFQALPRIYIPAVPLNTRPHVRKASNSAESKETASPVINQIVREQEIVNMYSGFGRDFIPAAVERQMVPRTSPVGKPLSIQSHHVNLEKVNGGKGIQETFVDTHCHMFTTLSMLQEKCRDRKIIPAKRVDLLAKTLFPKNLTAIVDIHCDLPLDDNYLFATQKFQEWPDNFRYYFAAGAHPHTAILYSDSVHAGLILRNSHPQSVAWGECGLDYFKNDQCTFRPQREVFARQLDAAVELGKPIIVHTREADEDTLAVLRDHVPKDHHLHIHCFTASRNMASSLLSEFPNAFLGITGVVTYNNLELQELIRSGELPLERMLLETDAPFMIPKNIYPWLKENAKVYEERRMRYVTSHGGMIPFVAEKVAELVNEGKMIRAEEGFVDVEDVLRITRLAAGRMYGIKV
ncbi:hypothetical protein RUND412_008769 [Rhizina undulata]